MHLFNTFLLPGIFTILPCLIKPFLLNHPEPWLVYIAGVLMIGSQPKTSFVPGSASIKTEHDASSNSALFLFSYVFLGISIFFFIKNPPMFENSPYRVYYLFIGVFLIILGLILRLGAIKTLGKYFSANLELKEDHKLIKNGIFKYIRHPSYLGALLILIAPPLLYQQNLIFLATIVGIIAVYAHRIRLEEKMLIKKFPRDYEKYKKNSWALLPPIW